MPTASGLWDHTADKKRAVDLVRRFGDGCFELIELKVNSHTPLRAAVEIVQYTLLFCLARDRYAEQDLACKELLQAKEVHLQGTGADRLLLSIHARLARARFRRCAACFFVAAVWQAAHRVVFLRGISRWLLLDRFCPCQWPG